MKLKDRRSVKYTVLLPTSHHNRSCLFPGADPDWLLLARRTQHSHCGITQGMKLCGPPAHPEPRLVRELSPMRVLSVCIGKKQLPWENESVGDKEGG